MINQRLPDGGCVTILGGWNRGSLRVTQVDDFMRCEHGECHPEQEWADYRPHPRPLAKLWKGEIRAEV